MKKPKPKSGPTLLARVHHIAWSSGWRKLITLSLGFIGLLAGTISKVADAWPRVEPYTYVSSGFFRDQMGTRDKLRDDQFAKVDRHQKFAEQKLDSKLNAVQLDVARQSERAAQAEVYKWQDKVDDEKDADKRAVYRDRLHDYQNSLNALQDQIKALNRSQ